MPRADRGAEAARRATSTRRNNVQTDADVLVIGAGISGLTTAFGLHRRGCDVLLAEAGPRAGGVIGTRRRDGVLYELGPNSTLDTTPLINELLDELGIRGERLEASKDAAIRYVVRGGKPVALPTSPGAFFTTPAFTLGAKLRLFAEPFIAPTPPGVEESIAAFVRRRLGTEFLDYAIDPFVAGIYAGDPEQIAVPAAFPRLLALEQKYGSLIKGQIQGARERKKNKEVAKNAAKSFSFRQGMQTVTDALAAALPRAEYGVRVERVTRDGDGTFVVDAVRGSEPLRRRARAVVMASPAYATAAMIGSLAPAAAQALAAIPYAPIAIVASAYRRADVAHSLVGFGFLVPKKERRRILGSLFSSSMFEGRAPEGIVLLTTFAGGRRNPEIAALADEAVAAAVHAELADLVGAGAAPLWQEVVRWEHAIPQYNLGHLALLQQVEAAETAVPGLYFCANYRGGVSVSDCIKNGRGMAERIAAALAQPGGSSLAQAA
jgi:oxygen-dependent protoporphyrinogen oxidase